MAGAAVWARGIPDRVEADINKAIEEATANIAAICAVPPGHETYENTFAAFDIAKKASLKWGGSSTLLETLGAGLPADCE